MTHPKGHGTLKVTELEYQTRLMAKTDHLQQVRDLIDDVDGVAFGKVGETLDEMATACDRAIAERAELIAALMPLAFFNGKPASAADMERLGALFANARAALTKVQTP